MLSGRGVHTRLARTQHRRLFRLEATEMEAVPRESHWDGSGGALSLKKDVVGVTLQVALGVALAASESR